MTRPSIQQAARVVARALRLRADVTGLTGAAGRGIGAGLAAAAGLVVAAGCATLLAAPGAAVAAPGDVLWRDFTQRSQGGVDAYNALAVTPLGRACAAGTTSAAPGAPGDVLVRTYAAGGSVTWQRVWTWPGRSDDGGAAIARDRRGSFLVAGSSGSSWLLLKYSAGGYLQWVRRGRAPYARASLQAVTVDGAGDVYAAGTATYAGGDRRLLVLKLSSNGAPRWRRTIGSNAGDAAATCIALGGGDVYVAGRSATGPGTSAAVTVKYSAGGTRRWMQAYAAGGAEAVTASGIGYADGPVVAGHGTADGGITQAFALRYRPDGGPAWLAGYEANGVAGDRFDAVVATSGGGACVTGSRQVEGTAQMLTAAFDAQGVLAWESVTPGAAGGLAVCRTAAGFCATGGDNAAVAVLLSSDGAQVGGSSLSPAGHTVLRPAAVRAAGTEYLYAAGSAAAGGGTAAMLVRYRPWTATSAKQAHQAAAVRSHRPRSVRYDTHMTSREALRRLNRNREKLRTHHVRHIAVFGSTARNEATPHSDVDLLVEFQPGAPVGLFAYVRLLDFLADVMDTRIDLATPGALRPEMRDEIVSEAVRAF